MPLILGIESTCDETAAALVAGGRRVLAETIASQVDLHAVYGGVVPEIASRAHIENLLPTLAGTIAAASASGSTEPGLTTTKPGLATAKPGRHVDKVAQAPDPPDVDIIAARLSELDITAIAVAHRPGLIGSLVVGLTAAKTLAWALGKPLIPVDHIHAHLYSVLLDSAADPELPAVGLVVSGGHTSLYLVRGWTDITPLGRTIDDAVGEAYDKVAAILGLGYPGGPVIDRLAADGDPKAVKFPRSMLGRDSLDFSFSGLKTAVLYHVRGFAGRELDPARLSEQDVKDICASFQAAAVGALVAKLRRALERTQARSVIVGGGVSANTSLRAALPGLGVPTHSPALRFCTDNAAMIAGMGHVLLQEGRTADLGLDAATMVSD